MLFFHPKYISFSPKIFLFVYTFYNNFICIYIYLVFFLIVSYKTLLIPSTQSSNRYRVRNVELLCYLINKKLVSWSSIILIVFYLVACLKSVRISASRILKSALISQIRVLKSAFWELRNDDRFMQHLFSSNCN